jgi:hypothetical protein
MVTHNVFLCQFYDIAKLEIVYWKEGLAKFGYKLYMNVKVFFFNIIFFTNLISFGYPLENHIYIYRNLAIFLKFCSIESGY